MIRPTKTFVLLAASALVGVLAFGLWQTLQPAPITAPDDAPPPIVAATHQQVRALETQTRTNTDDARTYAQLGQAYVQSARETGDGVYMERAQRAFERALALDERATEALSGMGTVALSEHDFETALRWGRRALDANPHRAATYGILVDAHIELGQYAAAIAAAQTMVDMRPDLASYSRVSYLRELHGDLDGAIEAMQRAVSAGSGSLEHAAWCRVYLGHLYFHQGDVDAAEAQYRRALALLPTYGHALGGLGQVARARAQFSAAVAHYEAAVEAFPIPEYVIALGAAYEAAGQERKAADRFQQAIAVLEDEREGGMDVDEELAMLLLDRNRELPRALELARGAYDRRPTVKNASILAWAYYKNGAPEQALPFARESLRLGTKEAVIYYRAGTIANAAGEVEQARSWLQQALTLNPHFDNQAAARAKAYLAAL